MLIIGLHWLDNVQPSSVFSYSLGEFSPIFYVNSSFNALEAAYADLGGNKILEDCQENAAFDFGFPN